MVEQEIVDVVLSAIGRGSGAARVMALNWRNAGILRVERRAPLTTTNGKVLHLLRAHAKLRRLLRARRGEPHRAASTQA